MKEFKKLFQVKRIITFVLAVAMVVTMMPTTAFAAPMTSVSLEQNETEVVASEATVEERVLTMDLEGEETEAVYYGGSPFSSLDYLKSLVRLTASDGTVMIPQAEDITLAWKVVSGNDLVNLPGDATEPVDAGTYNLSVSLAAREGQYKAAKIDEGVTFTIVPAKVIVEPYTTPDYDSVKAGTKVGDIKVSGAYVNYSQFNSILDNTETKDKDESKDSPIAIAVTVRDAFDAEKKALAADTVLVSNGDYVVDFVASFTEKGKEVAKGNYVIKEIAPQDVEMNDSIPTKITVTYAKEWEEQGNVIHRTYTGKEIAISASTSDTVSGNDYFAKVQYEEWDSEKGEYVYKDVTDAKLEGAWYEKVSGNVYTDLQGNSQYKTEWVKMESAPVDAGTYHYRLSYAGLDGVYAKAETEVDLYDLDGDIVVVIDPKSVVLVPELNKEAVFYEGMTEADVLDQIDYKVYAKEDKDLKEEIPVDKNTVWGTSYVDHDESQPYEPVFKLQYAMEEKGEDGKYAPIKDSEGNYNYVDNGNESLKARRVYRVIFTGDKAVVEDYEDEIREENILDINQKVTTAELNFSVSKDNETLSKHVVTPITVNAGQQSKIDITKIIEDLKGKGTSLENPETRVYNGNALYEKKANYKKAVVKVDDKEVKGASIEYKWYRNTNDSITDNIFSENGEPYAEGENTFDKNWGEGSYSVPHTAGVYKLEITYKGSPKQGYAPSKANVYYVIEKQPVRLALEGEYKAFIGHRISDFLYRIEREQQDISSLEKLSKATISGNTISGNEWVPMEKSELDRISGWWIDYKILETVGDAEPIVRGTWYDGVFREDAKYELIADIDFYEDEYDGVYANYTDKKYVFKNVTEDGKTYQIREVDTWEESVPVTVENMGTTQLSVSVNETALGKNTKVYDGKPFDLAAFLGDAIAIVKEDKTVVSDVVFDYYLYGEDFVQVDFGEWGWVEDLYTEVVHAGEYKVIASYAGDTTYAEVYEEIANVTITPAKITVTPVITEDVVAGNTPESIWNNSRFQQNLVFEGVADVDKDLFTYDPSIAGFRAITYEYGWDFIKKLGYITYDEDGDRVSGVLKGEKSYTIKVDKNNLWSNDPYDRDYDVEYKEATFTTVRGTSRVTSIDDKDYLYYEYFTNDVNEDIVFVEIDTTKDGLNQTIVPINAIPYSYCYYYDYNDGEYKMAGYGNFLAVRIQIPAEYNFGKPDTAMYKNAIEAQGGIIVREGSNYIDVVLDAAEKEPKTFAIRWEDGYVETFTFDFSKADIMGNLAEAVAPKSIAFNGASTKMAVGEIQELDLKLTKVQFNDVICISYSVDKEDILSVDEYGEVTALKKGSATVIATPVKLENGKKVAIEGAKTAKVKITVKDVTAPKIKKVYTYDNYAYVTYDAIADGYRREVYVLKGKNLKAQAFEDKIKLMKQGQWEDLFAVKPVYITGKYASSEEITGLDANTDYTVYIRNVSGVRKADNGNNVEFSYAGTTKSFKTTKAQVVGLSAWLKDAEYVDNYYKVDLSQGKVSMDVAGVFYAKEMDPASDEEDKINVKLPLNATLKKTYENPKLKYYVGDSSKIATVDKKGNVKLNGVGTVKLYVEDTVTGCETHVALVIKATPTKVTGNKTKLNVGQSIALEDLLTYYAGKKKLVGDFARNVVIDDELVKAFAENDAFELSEDGIVTAVKEGGKLQVNLTDSYIAKNDGQATANVTLTTTPLETVKNLKVADAKKLGLNKASLANNYAVIQFTGAENAKAFKIEITDQRGRLIRSSYVDRSSLESHWVYKEKKYYYTYEIDRLTQQSKYNVTVTPRYYDASAKAAKLSITTTKIPASTVRVYPGDPNEGENIVVVGNGNNISSFLFTSGNAYSLEFQGDGRAESMGTDTLTWTSSNKKVATVKGVSGSYHANLKALRAGTTIIEVKSKITKEVVASWEIVIQPVGDGYAKGRRYYDENTPENHDIFVKTIKLNREVKVNGEAEFKFTAPENGEYSFYSVDTCDYCDTYGTLYNEDGQYLESDDDSGEDNQFKIVCELSEGQTVRLNVRGWSGNAIDASVYVTKN